MHRCAGGWESHDAALVSVGWNLGYTELGVVSHRPTSIVADHRRLLWPLPCHVLSNCSVVLIQRRDDFDFGRVNIVESGAIRRQSQIRLERVTRTQTA